jgi:UDP:flavonoid glycosyltransferase YjiC (YdhE family)
MKAILFSLGTRGDMEPFLAIAQLLKERGWEVICSFPEQFKDIVEETGIPFEPLSKRFMEMVEGEQGRIILGGKGSIIKKIKAIIWMIRESKVVQKVVIKQQRDLIDKINPDRVIYNGKCSYPVIWGMANPGRSIMISPIPCFIHYVRGRAVVGMNFNLGPFINKLTYTLQNFALFSNVHKTSKIYQKEFEGIDFSSGRIQKNFLTKEKMIYTVSPALFPRPEYWPEQVHIVGYHERRIEWNWEADELLLDFLGTYKKTLFITFGSMINPEPEVKTRILLEALKDTGIPAIINTASGGLKKPGVIPKNVLFLEKVPYDWILPKVYAVIHHGGSGTTHTALKYGCASMIIPHIFDQFYWNDLMANLGVGPKGVSIKKLNVKVLRRKMMALFNNSLYRKNAEILSGKIHQENFKDQLYKLIER